VRDIYLCPVRFVFPLILFRCDRRWTRYECLRRATVDEKIRSCGASEFDEFSTYLFAINDGRYGVSFILLFSMRDINFLQVFITAVDIYARHGL